MTNLSPIYKIYPDLEEIDLESVETEEGEELYYKSLLRGCKNCDLIKDTECSMTVHFCSRNDKSKYYEHQQETFNRKIENDKILGINKIYKFFRKNS